MKTFYISLHSKNGRSLKKFLKFFKNTFRYLKTLQKILYKKKKRKIMAILKSPHVNKRAQEQFEINTLPVSMRIRLNRPFGFFTILKNIKTYLFPDINVKLRPVFSKEKQLSIEKYFFNINNFRLKLPTIRSKIRQNLKQTALLQNKNLARRTLKRRKFSKVVSRKILCLLDIYGSK
jgi:ribosomal protein S10